MNQKRRQGNPNPGGFKAELKIKPLPASSEEAAKQYLINLVLSGYILVSEEGAIISKKNIREALETWK
jgi:hypothetical protein